MAEKQDRDYGRQNQDRLDDQGTPEDEDQSADRPSGETSRRDPESGMPGGGVGRRDETGRSGVYPASDEQAAPPDAKLVNQAEWGQGDRGTAGANDSGQSELTNYWDERRRGEELADQDESKKNDER